MYFCRIIYFDESSIMNPFLKLATALVMLQMCFAGQAQDVPNLPETEAPPVYYTEEMPEFPGGQDSLKAFLQREVVYPKVAKDNGITGIVLVEFVVEKDGRISHGQVKVPLWTDCDVEALRAIMSMPKWKPARNMGRPVRCYYQVPVMFIL